MLKKILETEGKNLVDNLRESYQKTGVNASGKLSDSTSYDVTQTTDLTRLTIEINKYGTLLQPGRRPGKVPYNFDKIILKWALDKGIRVKNPKSFAFLVARKIRREGTKAYPNKGPKVLSSVINDKAINRIVSEVAVGAEAEIVSNLNDIIKLNYAYSK